MIWSFAKVFKEKPQTKQKTSKPFYRWKIKRRNYDRNSYCSLIKKEKNKSHNFKPPNRPTQAQRKEQMQAKWGHRPDWKFRDFKPLDRLFTKRCLWLRATSFYLQSFINHKRKISWSFLFFFIFVTRIWMLYHRAIIYETNIKKKYWTNILYFMVCGILIFNHASTQRWSEMQRISTDDFDALTQDFLKPRLLNRGFSLHYIFHLFLLFVFAIFFLIFFFSIVCRHFL